MALLEILHKYCAWNCPNEENGCDYVFTGKDRTEYWTHVNSCPFSKSDKNDMKETETNEEKEGREILHCRCGRIHGNASYISRHATQLSNVKVNKAVKNKGNELHVNGESDMVNFNFNILMYI